MNQREARWPFFWPWLDLAPNRLMQSILPDWSLARVEVNNFAGEPAIEKRVVESVASYGKQLGILTEAVLALSGDAPAERAERLDRVRELARRIEDVKKNHADDLETSAKRAMASLAQADPERARRIAEEYARGASS